MIRAVGRLAALAGLLACSACASIVEGDDQAVDVDTVPVGAACELSRDGATIAQLAATPGSVRVSKSRDDIRVECRKPGYQTRSKRLVSEFETAALGNLILGGVVGLGVDAATGAMHGYPSEVQLRLPPDPGSGDPVPGAADRSAQADGWPLNAPARTEAAQTEADPTEAGGAEPSGSYPLRLTPDDAAAARSRSRQAPGPGAPSGSAPASSSGGPAADPPSAAGTRYADRYFAQRKQAVRTQAAQAVQRVHTSCGDPARKPVCAEAIRIIERRRDARLAEIEADHALAGNSSSF